MRKVLHRMWSRVELASVLDSDSAEMRRRKTSLVVIALLSCLTGVISITNTLAAAEAARNLIPPIIFIAVIGSATFLFLRTKRLAVLLYPFLLLTLCIPVAFQLIIGGFSGSGSPPIILWALLAPVGALLFRSTREAVWWFVAFWVLLSVCLAVDEWAATLLEPATHTQILVAYGISIFCLSGTLFATVWYFFSGFQREHARAEQLVLDLTGANDALKETLSELKETQLMLVQSEKMAAIGKLAAGLTHEINTPIGAILSNTQTGAQAVERIRKQEATAAATVDGGRLSSRMLDTLGRSLESTADAGRRLGELVGRLQSFVRIDEAEVKPADLHEGIESAIALLHNQTEPRSIEVICRFDRTIPRVLCRPAEINQVLMHLLQNAVDAIEGPGTITITTLQDTEWVTIKVHDTGRGMNPEEIEGLFDPGISSSRSRVKLKMGLPLSHQIVVRHGGELRVESTPGEGSTFTVKLPVSCGTA
jgi:signal transduction histidine kinase